MRNRIRIRRSAGRPQFSGKFDASIAAIETTANAAILRFRFSVPVSNPGTAGIIRDPSGPNEGTPLSVDIEDSYGYSWLLTFGSAIGSNETFRVPFRDPGLRTAPGGYVLAGDYTGP